jgi:hypothetical protein
MKKINKKKFYPSKQDYQELEDSVIGMDEQTEAVFKDPRTFMYVPYPVYPVVPSYPTYPGPYITLTYGDSTTGGLLTE